MPPDRSTPVDGVTLLAAGHPDEALVAFRRAAEDDPEAVVPRTGEAAALAELDDDDLPRALDQLRRLRVGSSVDRHHVEVVVLALAGRTARATGLGTEHLLEHPDDRLVRHVLERWCPP